MYSIDNIISFIREETATHDEIINTETDIFNDLGVAGDDCSELIEAYSKKFTVDLSNYLWYFHHEEEGSWNSIGGIFFKPPNLRVKRIPITPLTLLQFANTGKWNLDYPEHKIPQKRYDIFVNGVLLFLVLGYLLYLFIKWLI